MLEAWLLVLLYVACCALSDGVAISHEELVLLVQYTAGGPVWTDNRDERCMITGLGRVLQSLLEGTCGSDISNMFSVLWRRRT